MNWLSQEEIKRRAEESPEEALNVSIEHWEQIAEAIKAGIDIGDRYMSHHCGLCQRKSYLDKPNCSWCILFESDSVTCCQEWRSFSTNAQAMLNRLYMERGKRYPAGEAQEYKAETKECKKEKPALRHGDYGYTNISNEPRLCIKDDMLDNSGDALGFSRFPKDYTILGNIFDDLKRNAEDLEEFEVDDRDNRCGGEIKVQIDGGSDIWINDECLILCTTQKFHQKLGQLIATAKRRSIKSK